MTASKINPRRRFLKNLGAAVVATPLAPALAKAQAISATTGVSSTPAPGPLALWENRHSLFDYDPQKIHCANFLLSSHPRPVREEIARLAHVFNINPPAATATITPRTKALQAQLAQYFGCDPDGIALTSSTIDGIYIFWEDVRLQPTDEVIVTTHEHPDMLNAIKYRHAKTPLTIKRVSMYDINVGVPSIEAMVQSIKDAITPQTRVVTSTWVHSSTGVKAPIGAIGRMIKEINLGRAEDDRILFMVDGVHGFAIETDSFAELNCDFFTSGTHKWLSGPRGTGFLAGTQQAWKRLVRPSHPDNQKNAGFAGRMYSWHGYFAYEHRFAVGAAIDLQLALGRTRMRDHVHALSFKLKSALSQMPHIQLYTPIDSERSAGITCFDVRGMTPPDVVKALAQRNIVASVTPYTPSYARIGLFHTNTETEVDTIIEAVRALDRGSN